MEVSIKTDISVEDFADALANSEDEVQGEFLNVFFKSLDLACGSEYKSEMQLISIESHLSERAKKKLKFFYDENE
jgi:hypothetical protein